ncbi:MAG: lysozyme inhibitor LprI family protein [Gammaproteobacteria bacterium]|nr:lysozyme inhibitor LprI family protein [Gammaproteobacteria bacterium]MDH5652288.1 lysozyme inhibitor LprI family protein [Gammaproteobacteria bacterium]
MRDKTRLFLLLGILCSSSAVQAAEIKAGFDCKKAGTDIEKAICANQALADLDIALAKAYKAARKDKDAATLAVIKASQRNWIKSRTDACKGRQGSDLQECLTGSMSRRIKELDGYLAITIPDYSGKPAYKHSKYAMFIKSLPEDYVISPKILVYPGDSRELNLEIIDKKRRKQVGHITVNYWNRAYALYLSGKYKVAGVVAHKARTVEPKWEHKEAGQEYVVYHLETSDIKNGRDIIIEATMQLRMSLWFELNLGLEE